MESSTASALLSVLCRELPRLRAVADDTGDRVELENVLAAARRGEPIMDGLRSLGLLRVLVDWDTRAGVVAVPGTGEGHVALGSYRCPSGICRRVERPGPGEDRPVCALLDTPLRFG